MTPDEFIVKANEHLKYIKDLYESAYPDGKYLTLSLVNGTWQYNNEHWGKDKAFPVIFPKRD